MVGIFDSVKCGEFVASRETSSFLRLFRSIETVRQSDIQSDSQSVRESASQTVNQSVTVSQTSLRLVTVLHCSWTETQTSTIFVSPHIFYFRSTDSSVSIVTGRPIIRGSISGRWCSVLQHSYQL
jgi:hypothetical protein